MNISIGNILDNLYILLTIIKKLNQQIAELKKLVKRCIAIKETTLRLDLAGKEIIVF